MAAGNQQVVKEWLGRVLAPYPSSDLVTNDTLKALRDYPTLSVRTDAFTYDSGQTALLLLVHGTVPITYRSNTYHIPLNIWFPFEYPRKPPMVFVVPTSDMNIRKSDVVDPGGKVGGPIMESWERKWEAHSLGPLLTELQAAFSTQPPVYARNANPPPASSYSPNPSQAHPVASTSTPPQPQPPQRPLPPTMSGIAGGVNGYPGHDQGQGQVGGEQPPPPPARPRSVVMPSGMGPVPHGVGAVRQESLPAYGSARPPPLPPSPMRHSTYANPPTHPSSTPPPPPVPAHPTGYVPPHTQPRSPPPPPLPPYVGGQGQGVPGYAARPPPPGMSGYGGPPQPGLPPQQQQQVRQGPLPPISPVRTGNMGTPPPGWAPPHHPQQGMPPQGYPLQQTGSPTPMQRPVAAMAPAPVAAAAPVAAPKRAIQDLMSSDLDEVASPISAGPGPSFPAPFSNPNLSSPGPAPPSRPLPPATLHLHSLLHQHISTRLPLLLQSLNTTTQQLLSVRSDLETGEPAIRDEMARLEAVRSVCAGVVDRMGAVVEEGEKRVGEMEAKGEISVDEVVCSISIVHNQLIDLVAEDNAIEDTIYHLTRALDSERIDLDKFLKSVRILAREQYQKRALIEKIREGLRGSRVGAGVGMG